MVDYTAHLNYDEKHIPKISTVFWCRISSDHYVLFVKMNVATLNEKICEIVIHQLKLEILGKI